MTQRFEFGPDARPAGQLRLAKLHLAMLGLYGLLLLGVLAVGIFRMDHVPWLLVFIMSLPMLVHLALFKGVSAGKTWARYGTVAVGVLSLAVFPIGTIAGGYMVFHATSAWDL